MSYLDEFQLLIQDEKLAQLLRLWEEYCLNDQTDGIELLQILKLIKNSPFANTFGQLAETVLPLWNRISETEIGDEILTIVLDLQTTNSPVLADLAIEYLKKYYSDDKHFNEKLRIVGLRSKHSFQGCLSNYKLLTHMKKGACVFHTGGWGVGEVIDFSLLREHVLLEFEGIAAPKDLSFDNAFKNLIPLGSDHFLSRRFCDPDGLESEGKKDPLNLIRLLLKDLGPKTASEIKDELSELVIAEKDWTKWWQAARGKIKKDTQIKSPKTSKEPFELREEAVSHDSRFQELIEQSKNVDQLIQVVYNFTRDFPETVKNAQLMQNVKERLLQNAEGDPTIPELSLARKVQMTFLLEDLFPQEFSGASVSLANSIENFESVMDKIEIQAFKKKFLVLIRENRPTWQADFLRLILPVGPNPLRDYMLKELISDESAKPLIHEKLRELLNKMTLYPEAFFWYFQKIPTHDVFFTDKESQFQFLEAFLILLHYIEEKPEYRELAKKMHTHITAKRYAIIRSFIEGASVVYLREFLLLASKCHILTKQDRRILQSLAEVVQPALKQTQIREEEPIEIIWTTQEGYERIQKRIHRLGTVETVENAREIEAARSLGDLRENSEYKFALEKRSQLQNELRRLTKMVNQARIITKDDITTQEVGVGAIVELIDSKGNRVQYTLLGPWDADPDQHILSFQSKLAQTMIGRKKGERFDFQGEIFTVQNIDRYL